jgi:biotin transport system ATP-binding protein
VTAALRLDGVSVRFGDRLALDDVSCDLSARRIAVVGANGSGKSTFARLLNGLVTATAGQVLVNGLDPSRDKRAVRREVGFIFCNPDSQIVMPTVSEDLAFSLRNRGLSSAQISERVAETLERFGLTPLAAERCFELSSGQKQLLAVAAVFISNPSVVVADEPTALLDAHNTKLIRRHLLDEALAQTVVVVTHDLSLAAQCDIALRFNGGRLVATGDAVDIVRAYRKDVE